MALKVKGFRGGPPALSRGPGDSDGRKAPGTDRNARQISRPGGDRNSKELREFARALGGDARDSGAPSKSARKLDRKRLPAGTDRNGNELQAFARYLNRLQDGTESGAKTPGEKKGPGNSKSLGNEDDKGRERRPGLLGLLGLLMPNAKNRGGDEKTPEAKGIPPGIRMPGLNPPGLAGQGRTPETENNNEKVGVVVIRENPAYQGESQPVVQPAAQAAPGATPPPVQTPSVPTPQPVVQNPPAAPPVVPAVQIPQTILPTGPANTPFPILPVAPSNPFAFENPLTGISDLFSPFTAVAATNPFPTVNNLFPVVNSSPASSGSGGRPLINAIAGQLNNSARLNSLA